MNVVQLQCYHAIGFTVAVGHITNTTKLGMLELLYYNYSII